MIASPLAIAPAAAPLDRVHGAESTLTARVWIAAIVLAAAFYVIDHDFYQSDREAYAATIEEMAGMSEGGNASRRLAFLSVAALGLGLFFTGGHRLFRPLSPLGLLMAAAVAWCLASVLWSEAPDITSRRLVVLACCYLGAVGVGVSLAPRELATVGILLGLFALGIGFFAEASLGNFTPWVADYRFAGTLHPNTQGLYLAMLACGAFCLIRDDAPRRWLYIGLIVLALAALILTKSRTSTAGTLLSLGVIWSLQASWRVRLTGIAVVVGLMAAVLFAILASGVDLEKETQQAVLLGREEQAESLTGRLPIWFELMEQISHRPWLGHGYDTFWTVDNVEIVSERVEWPVKEAHNGYLDQTLAIGLIGAGLLVLIALASLAAGALAYDATGDGAYGFVVGLVLFALTNCFLESGMVMPQCPSLIMACAIAQLAHRRLAAPRRVQAPGVV